MIGGTSFFANGELFALAPSASTVLRKPVEIDERLAASERVAVFA